MALYWWMAAIGATASGLATAGAVFAAIAAVWTTVDLAADGED